VERCSWCCVRCPVSLRAFMPGPCVQSARVRGMERASACGLRAARSGESARGEGPLARSRPGFGTACPGYEQQRVERRRLLVIFLYLACNLFVFVFCVKLRLTLSSSTHQVFTWHFVHLTWSRSGVILVLRVLFCVPAILCSRSTLRIITWLL
jgi:hypothetical protein